VVFCRWDGFDALPRTFIRSSGETFIEFRPKENGNGHCPHAELWLSPPFPKAIEDPSLNRGGILLFDDRKPCNFEANLWLEALSFPLGKICHWNRVREPEKIKIRCCKDYNKKSFPSAYKLVNGIAMTNSVIQCRYDFDIRFEIFIFAFSGSTLKSSMSRSLTFGHASNMILHMKTWLVFRWKSAPALPSLCEKALPPHDHSMQRAVNAYDSSQ
jgi:hypothetical protein